MKKTIKQPDTYSTTFEAIEDGEVFFITQQAQNPPDKRVYQALPRRTELLPMHQMKTKLPPLPKTGERRLLKLIAFLEQLPEEKFNFSRLITATVPEKTCGTVCCAAGWLPAVFPKLVQWQPPRYDGDTVGIQQGDTDEWHEVVAELFGLPDATTAWHLLVPYQQSCVDASLPMCGDDATPKQVAKMLRKYLVLTKEAA